jgi:epoxyqueuosine reductase
MDDSLLADLRNEAARLGFSRLGVAPAVRPPRHEEFRAWLSRGLAGATHDWLARHEPLRADPRSLLPGAASVIMLSTDHALGHGPEAAPPVQGRGRVARYARGADYHDLLRDRSNALAAWLESRAPGCRTRAVVDSAPLAERDFGALAGLGWIGKNTLLIHPQAGSYFLLAAILTDLALPVEAAVTADHCGSCTACLDACPTAAFPEPHVLDAGRCISGLSIEDHGTIAPDLRAAMDDWVFGCDVCQEVCPWNRRAPGSDEPTFQPRAGTGDLPLADLLALDEPGFRGRFRGTPLLRAKRRGLLRSAAIALGNRPDPAAFAVLARAVADGEEVVRGAAAWALGRWIRAGVMAEESLATLADRHPVEDDATVRREIEAALP